MAFFCFVSFCFINTVQERIYYEKIILLDFKNEKKKKRGGENKSDNTSTVMTVSRTENGIKYVYFHDKGCNEKEKCKTNLLLNSAISVLLSIIYSHHVDKNFCVYKVNPL